MDDTVTLEIEEAWNGAGASAAAVVRGVDVEAAARSVESAEGAAPRPPLASPMFPDATRPPLAPPMYPMQATVLNTGQYNQDDAALFQEMTESYRDQKAAFIAQEAAFKAIEKYYKSHTKW